MRFNKYIYNDFTENYDQTIKDYVMHYEEMINVIFNEIPDEDLKVLEMGCGSGNLTKKISEKQNLRITAVDISETLLIEAQQKLKESSNVNLKLGDILGIDLKSNKFDYILSFLFVHELYPTERDKLMDKLKEWSKSKTQIIIGDNFNVNDQIDREKCIEEWYEWMIGRGIKTVDALKEIEMHIRDSIYTADYLADLLKKVYFSISKILWSRNIYKVMVFKQ